MDAKKLMDALTGVKDKYIREADIFQPVPAEPAPHAPRLLAWAGGIAACAVAVLGLLLLGRLGLLAPLPSGQDGTSAAAVSSSCETAEDSALQSGDENPLREAAGEVVSSAPESAPALGAPESASALGTIDGLVPLEELPQLTFPTREEADTVGTTIGCGEALRREALSPSGDASIFGQQSPAWEGLSLTDGDPYSLSGVAEYKEDGSLARVILTLCQLQANDQYQDFLTMEISPGYVPSLGTHLFSPSHTCDVWGTEVATYAAYDDEKGSAQFALSFLTGKQGEEGVLGVTAECRAGQGSPVTEETAQELLTRLASQCLRPGNTFTLAGAERQYRVLIDMNGYLYDGDASTFPGAASAFLGRAAVLTGDDAVSEAADDSCVQVLTLNLPLLIAEQTEPAEGEIKRELFALYSVDYGFFQRDGEKVIEEIGGYGDVAGIICTPRGGATRDTPWYPEDGSRYLPSIAEFIGDESAAEQAVQQAHTWPETARTHAEALLVSYLEQNGMTGWKKKAADGTVSPFGPREGDLRVAAEKVAQQYVDSWLAMTEEGYPPLAKCFYTDLAYSESADPDSDLQVSCKMVFRLKDPDGDPGYWLAGNTSEGTGEYQGYYTAFRFIYAKREEGQWVITGSGTGP